MNVYVNVNDKRWNKYNIDFDKIANAVVGKKYKDSEVSIVLTNDDEIHKLNKEYRNIDKPTNVLSFELQDDILLGDIYISFDTVMKEAKEQGISFENHTAHMVVHGVLHLLGFDHIKDEEAEIMENKEVGILKKLNIKNPYMPESAVCKDFACCPGGRFVGWYKKSSGWLHYVLMAVFGLIAALGFAPFYMWWATVLGVAGAYYLMTKREKTSLLKTFLSVLPFSAVYAIAMFWWVLNSIYVVPELAQQFAVWTLPAIVGIGLLGGIVFSIPFVAISSVRTIPACRPFLFAGTWVFVLWLREWFLTGFPWNPIANITMPAPILTNSMSLWGALGLSFVVLGVVSATVELFRLKKNTSVLFTYAIFLMLVLVAVFAGKYNIEQSQMSKNSGSALIRIVQPAKSAVQKASHSRQEAMKNAEENIRNLFILASADGNPDLIVFPETSYPFVIVDNEFPLAQALGRTVVAGANYYSDGKMYNSMVVANKDGFIEKVYSKSHLVPFGEYRPLGDIIPTPGQLEAGKGAEIIHLDLKGRDFLFAPAICYEIIFSDSLVPSQVDGLPNAIINITNDTWFGTTPGTYQHLDMVRRYAIESGLPIVRANYSGISAFVSPDGNVISELPVAETGILDGFVWGAHNTPYRAIGRDGWMMIILLFSCICSISIYGLRKKD